MDERFVRQGQPRWKIWLWALVAVLLLIFIWNGFVVIPAGNVGVVIRFGAVQGEISEGLHLLIPFIEHVEMISVREQKYEFKAETFSKQQQNVYMDMAVNYVIEASMVQDTYRKIGDLQAIENKIVAPTVNQVVKSIIPDYPTDQIHINRDKIRQEILEKLNETVKRLIQVGEKDKTVIPGVRFVDVNLVNITFSKEYTDAIERKQVAEQDVQRAEMKRQEAVKNKEIAKVNAEAKQIEQQLVNQSLTSAILQNRWIEKWNGTLPNVMTGSGGGVILNLSDLKQTNP